jgi:Fe-S-cluster containining protein
MNETDTVPSTAPSPIGTINPVVPAAAIAAAATSHSPCATCGACCRSYLVPVCGYDVWRISTRQRLAPEQFVVARANEAVRNDGFVLEPGGPSFSLMLDKQGPLRLKQPCVFLVHLAGGHDRCGIYADRPVVCRAYPMALWQGRVGQRNQTLCPPGSWSAQDRQQPAWRVALLHQDLQFDLYAAVVARWNARVQAAAEGRRFALTEYLSYVLNVYDRIAALDAAVGEVALEQVRAS